MKFWRPSRPVVCPRCGQAVKPNRIDARAAAWHRSGKFMFDIATVRRGFGITLGYGTACAVCDSQIPSGGTHMSGAQSSLRADCGPIGCAIYLLGFIALLWLLTHLSEVWSLLDHLAGVR